MVNIKTAPLKFLLLTILSLTFTLNCFGQQQRLYDDNKILEILILLNHTPVPKIDDHFTAKGFELFNTEKDTISDDEIATSVKYKLAGEPNYYDIIYYADKTLSVNYFTDSELEYLHAIESAKHIGFEYSRTDKKDDNTVAFTYQMYRTKLIFSKLTIDTQTVYSIMGMDTPVPVPLPAK
jgi:hypothetical protein